MKKALDRTSIEDNPALLVRLVCAQDLAKAYVENQLFQTARDVIAATEIDHLNSDEMRQASITAHPCISVARVQ